MPVAPQSDPASPTCAAVLVAGGQGTRLGHATPKQFLEIGGTSILRRSAEPFASHPDLAPVVVITTASYSAMAESALAGLPVITIPSAGDERQETVRNALNWLASQPVRPDRVMIHDAARPLVDHALISRVLRAATSDRGAIAATPVRDTLKRAAVDTREIVGTLDRTGLWQAQTPQAFPFDRLLAAHNACVNTAVTDDAAVAEWAGLPVTLVPGDVRNLKITVQEDLAMASALIGASPTTSIPCTGTGYDVHRLVPGEGMALCGIFIPGPVRLSGHSDADVGLHALTDAVLGAIADGDIGAHFPPSDPQWKGAASDQFLIHAVQRVRDRGGQLVHVDLTLICEQPKIGPYRAAMRARVADITGISVDRVSIKATTSERLGFTGRGEGIAALASATVIRPI